MKKTILLFVLLAFHLFAYSQNKKASYEKIKNLKVEFINTQLELTTSEIASFWPIYNQYEKDARKIRNVELKKLRKEADSLKDIGALTDEKSAEFSKRIIGINRKMIRNKQKFYTDIESVLDSKKILKLHMAELDFNSKLIKQLQKQEK